MFWQNLTFCALNEVNLQHVGCMFHLFAVCTNLKTSVHMKFFLEKVMLILYIIYIFKVKIHGHALKIINQI